MLAIISELSIALIHACGSVSGIGRFRTPAARYSKDRHTNARCSKEVTTTSCGRKLGEGGSGSCPAPQKLSTIQRPMRRT